MSILKYNPSTFRSLNSSNLFDDLINDRFFTQERGSSKSFVPQVDISESEQAFELSVAIPGISKEELSIDLKDGNLTISGERKFSDELKEKKFHSLETRYGSFQRSFQLPDSINAEKVEANYENGLLNIVIPKDEKKVKNHSIVVN